tara:strand:+ start:180 stop:509 length:330 start_codon:yes stop_codon:yes gene_type:complete
VKCPKCRHKETRVTCTQHCSDHTVRYCRCLNCGHKYKTEEKIVKYKEKFIPSRAKLDVKKVKEIRAIAEKEDRKGIEKGMTITKLALQYGVEYSTIRNVIVGKTWKNVD